jgi:hypothetical protein
MVALVVTSGPLEGRRIELDDEFTIGRDQADLKLEDAEVSRRHARLRRVHGGLEIEDLGSSNGTYVNGVRITEIVTVGSGAVIRLGETTFRVEQPAAVTKVSAAPPELAESSPRVSETEDAAAAERRAGRGTEVRSGPPPIRRPRTSVAQSAPAQQEFGAFRAKSRRRRRGVATRLWLPMAMTYAAIIGTAAALIVYFAERN